MANGTTKSQRNGLWFPAFAGTTKERESKDSQPSAAHDGDLAFAAVTPSHGLSRRPATRAIDHDRNDALVHHRRRRRCVRYCCRFCRMIVQHLIVRRGIE